MGDFLGLTKFTESLSPMLSTLKVQELGALAVVAQALAGSQAAEHKQTAQMLLGVLNVRAREDVLLLKPEKEVKP